MARGLEAASHRGAISAKGKTLAVFGAGVDGIHPERNVGWRARGRRPRNIPNSIRTAMFFAVPGNVANRNCWRTNGPIKRGAKLSRIGKNFLQKYDLHWPPASPESSGAPPASLCPEEGFPPHEKRILSPLKADESTHTDKMIERLETGMSSSEIFAALFELELTGKVRRIPAKNFGEDLPVPGQTEAFFP